MINSINFQPFFLSEFNFYMKILTQTQPYVKTGKFRNWIKTKKVRWSGDYSDPDQQTTKSENEEEAKKQSRKERIFGVTFCELSLSFGSSWLANENWLRSRERQRSTEPVQTMSRKISNTTCFKVKFQRERDRVWVLLVRWKWWEEEPTHKVGSIKLGGEVGLSPIIY